MGVVNLFLSPTIERLADYIRNSQDQLASSVVSKDYQTFSLVDHARLPYDYQSQFEDIYPVSYTQLGIISENLKHERLTHTDNFHFKVLHPYSPEKVRATLFDLLTRHELLRSVINSSPEYDFLICNKKAYLAEDYIYIHQLSLEEYQVFDGKRLAMPGLPMILF